MSWAWLSDYWVQAAVALAGAYAGYRFPKQVVGVVNLLSMLLGFLKRSSEPKAPQG